MYKHLETKNALKDWGKIQSMSKSVKDKFKYFVVDILDNPRNLNTVEFTSINFVISRACTYFCTLK
jgi:hypothetical protein